MGVLIGAIIASYLANRKNRLKVVESALHGVLVGIFVGVVQILIIYTKNGFTENIVIILLIGAAVLIGAYIIVGALGGLVGTLLNVKFGKNYKESNMEFEEHPSSNKQKIMVDKMTDWKAVGIGALVNAVLTMVFTLVLFPLFFLGPVIGGFMATYLSREI